MDKDKLKDSEYDLKGKILERPEFASMAPNIDLGDPIIVYSNGDQYRVVPLELFTKTPLIYDQYFDKIRKKNKNIISDITIAFCPFSMSSVVYFGRYELTNNLYQNNLVMRDVKNSDHLVTQLDGKIYSETDNIRIFERLRKGEAKIMTLRNAITSLPDCTFLQETKEIRDQEPIPLKNKSQIVYGLEYLSSRVENSEDNKYTAIVPKDGKNKYDIQKNGIKDYLDGMIEKIREKGGIIVPSSEEAWLQFHPDSKKLELK